MDDLKLCFVNVEEKPEEIKNYELLIDKFIKTKNSELFEYIPFGLLVLIEYNLKNTKYTKKELERLFFKYVDNANDIYSLRLLCYYIFHSNTPYKKKALRILKKNVENFSDLQKEMQLHELLCVLDILLQLKKEQNDL